MRIGIQSFVRSNGANLQRTQELLAQLQTQATTQQRGQRFSEIADDAQRLIDLKALQARSEQFVRNTDIATTRLKAVDNVLDGIDKVAADFQKFLDGTKNVDDPARESLKLGAQGFLRTMADLLNTDLNGQYLFGGTRSDREPVRFEPAIDDPAWTTYFGTPANRDNAASTRATVDQAEDVAYAITNTVGADGVAGYYRGGVAFDQGDRVLDGLKARAGEAVAVDTGFAANENGFAKLMRALHIVAAAPLPQNPADPDSAWLADARALLTEAKTGLREIQSRAGSALVQLDTQAKLHKTEIGELQKRVADLEQVDLAETLTALSQTQTRLEASYQVTARLGQLKLADFLR
ncbi:MAG TPA: flagellin [Alphaproteobacteria bacterium]|nr:flagellin [Alphaproteobacteria bacterium]